MFVKFYYKEIIYDLRQDNMYTNKTGHLRKRVTSFVLCVQKTSVENGCFFCGRILHVFDYKKRTGHCVITDGVTSIVAGFYSGNDWHKIRFSGFCSF